VKVPITVLRDRFVPGGSPYGCVRAPLGEALARRFTHDAHLQPALSVLDTTACRVTKAMLKGEARIEVGCFIVDLDGPGKVATEAWRSATREAAAQLFEANGAGFYYETTHGARLCWLLPEPFVIEDPEAGREWSRFYLERLAHLERISGLVGDPSCHDFARIFRLPHVVREPGEAVEERLTLGDPANIAAWSLEISDADRARARELKPRAFEAPRLKVTTPTAAAGGYVQLAAERAPAANDDERLSPAPSGELWEELRAHDLVVRACTRGGWVVRCPNEAEHTKGRSGDGSTVFYAPTVEGGAGSLHCKHHACQALEQSDWIALLSAGKRQRRRVRIVSAHAVTEHPFIRLEIVPLDGGGPIYPPLPGWPAPRPGPATFTVPVATAGGSKGVQRKYASLWAAAGVDPPTDANPQGDLGGAVAELRGRTIDLEIGDGKVRRILPALERAA
jgi:hypothetical protein